MLMFYVHVKKPQRVKIDPLVLQYVVPHSPSCSSGNLGNLNLLITLSPMLDEGTKLCTKIWHSNTTKQKGEAGGGGDDVEAGGVSLAYIAGNCSA